MLTEIQHFIGGGFADAAEPVIETVNPTTEGVIGRQPDGGAATVDAAVRAARRAFEEGPWAGAAAVQRAAYLQVLADLIEENAEELAHLETSDNGLPIFQTQGGHIPRSVAHFRYFAAEALRMSGESFPLDGAYLNLVHREPLGVVGIISPWNGPLAVSTLSLAAALAAGNTCVLKPSEKAPLSIWKLSHLIAEAGFPPGVVNIVYGGGPSTGRDLSRHPDINAICFVGASEVGQEIMAAAAQSLKTLTLELGGKAPTIILADADIDRAVDGALLSVFSSNGEVCTAGSRILVEAPIFDRFLLSFQERASNIRVGDPLDPDTEVGPLISRAHRERVLGMIEAARQAGAKIACGERPPAHLSLGFFVAPTVLHDVSPDMAIMQEEVFGPVAAVLRVKDADDAVRVANATRFGLSASIWSGDTSRALAMARKIRAGGIGINSPTIRDIRVPFGGVKLSGLGRIGGRWSIEAFTATKTVSLRVEGYALPRLGLRRGAPAPEEEMKMTHDIHRIPEGLPVPEDDGAAAHLQDSPLPSVLLPSTEGHRVDVSRAAPRLVVFAYPRTGKPGQDPLVPNWNSIPGARGCTPQTCGYRDLFDEFRAMGVSVYGLSTQDSAYQAEMVERLHLPFPVLSDSELTLSTALKLPVFEVAGQTLLKRIALYAEDGVIRKVFYPVFPPDENALTVLEWLKDREHPGAGASG